MVVYLMYHDDVLYLMMLNKLKSQFPRMIVPFFDEYERIVL